MGVTVKFDLKQVNLAQNAYEVMKKNEKKYVNIVKQKAPSKTGELKDNITSKVTLEGNEARLQIGTGDSTYYSHFLEFGTKNMSPQPFMRPSYTIIKRDLMTELKKINN